MLLWLAVQEIILRAKNRLQNLFNHNLIALRALFMYEGNTACFHKLLNIFLPAHTAYYFYTY